ncbi:IS4 family transposase, partial [Caldibacillus thermoamylovorans]|nr:IS4 family transposase [Caldibacillus thermoamylovorans]
MINRNSQFNQLPKELDSVFSELEINKHLRQAGIKKSFGFSCSYLFQLIFCLIFQH